MAVTPDIFRARFTEFGTPPDAYLQSNIDAATLRTPAGIWGDLQDEGVLWLTAALLAATPMGVNAKLAAKDGSSRYQVERNRLAHTVVAGRSRVSGQTVAEESLLDA